MRNRWGIPSRADRHAINVICTVYQMLLNGLNYPPLNRNVGFEFDLWPMVTHHPLELFGPPCSFDCLLGQKMRKKEQKNSQPSQLRGENHTRQNNREQKESLGSKDRKIHFVHIVLSSGLWGHPVFMRLVQIQCHKGSNKNLQAFLLWYFFFL